MKRRHLLGLTGTTLAGSLAVGSSAFNVARADRTITVDVNPDYNAYLQLEEIDAGGRAQIDGGKLHMSIPGDESDHTDQDPEGVGTDSEYWFGRDVTGSHDSGLFKITNQGSESISVFSTQSETDGKPSITIYDVGGSNLLTEDEPSDPIGVGETLRCGVHINTHGVEIQETAYDVSLTINALATDTP